MCDVCEEQAVVRFGLSDGRRRRLTKITLKSRLGPQAFYAWRT